MGRTHYIYMNGSSGCMPDTLDLCFSVDEAVGMFETIFGDDLYQNFNLAELVEDDVISAGVVYDKLATFFYDDLDYFEDKYDDEDDFIESKFAEFLEDGLVVNRAGKRMEAIDEFGQLVRDRIVKDFRDSGYVSLGPDYGADYASWSPCDCDSPWEHSELSMEQWIREHGDLWFTEHYEVRLRYEGDSRPWEEIEVLGIRSSDHDEHDLEECIYKVLIENDRRRVLEVRWNWVGDSQGHYFVPEYAEAA